MKRFYLSIVLILSCLSLQSKAQEWSTLGTGTNNGVNSWVRAIAISGENVFVGGTFWQAGGTIAYYMARYNMTTSTWHAFSIGDGPNGFVYALEHSGEDLFVGGSFGQVGYLQPAFNVARYNLATNTWHTFKGTAVGVNDQVYALAVSGENVFVGGKFTQAGGQPVNYVARYNLTTNTWHSLGTDTSIGVNNQVYALAVLGDDVFVGGLFTQAGGQSVNYIARYNLTTNTWHTLGEGTNNGVSGAVNTLVVSGENLFVGGTFWKAGGQSANNVARYNLTTNTWHSLGTGISNGVIGVVGALAVSGENVFVAGGFTEAGGMSVNRVARYNLATNTWHTLGADNNNGVSGGNNPYVHVLEVSGDNVFVGGLFTQAGGLSANNVARYTESLTSIEDNGNLPTSYILHQNFPNPFNPSTIISFTIPSSEFVTLKVYDMLGREVTTIVNDNLTAGSHSFNFDASNLTSGVYFYKLQAGKFTEVKKMLLTK